ncbi:MAG: nicotinate (nicotinamide) nucleotide adenylyltransferase [Anaerolineales bacterium]|nr:nicotinate (nicotinamide) nucleotide adenylyltransferase [Anaerolineales bacterium]
MRIGIFGGTFDPPHLGHLILAAEAQYQLELDRLLFVLTPDPPHKQGQRITALDDRLDLIQAAIAHDSRFQLSRVDIHRPGPHYSVDTVRFLQEQYPSADLFFLMGGDSLRDLPTWYHPVEFIKACNGIGVMHRPDEEIDLSELEQVIPGITAKVIFIKAPLLEIASSQLRDRIREGRPYHYYLPDEVSEIIDQRGLYRK